MEVAHESPDEQADAAPARAVVECAELNASYGDVAVVSGFSLSCVPGQVVALIGPNGCGKSTLLKRVAGLLPDTGGSLRVCGRDAHAMSSGQINALGLHYVPQVRDVFPSLTVEENLLIGHVDRGKLPDVLGMFPILTGLMGRRAGRLSGGERKAVAIGRAFMQPGLAVMLLDEPSAGLSPKATSDLWPVIAAATSSGVGVVIVEQRVDDVLALADMTYVMVAGTLRLAAPSSEIRALGAGLGHMFVDA